MITAPVYDPADPGPVPDTDPDIRVTLTEAGHAAVTLDLLERRLDQLERWLIDQHAAGLRQVSIFDVLDRIGQVGDR